MQPRTVHPARCAQPGTKVHAAEGEYDSLFPDGQGGKRVSSRPTSPASGAGNCWPGSGIKWIGSRALSRSAPMKPRAATAAPCRSSKATCSDGSNGRGNSRTDLLMCSTASATRFSTFARPAQRRAGIGKWPTNALRHSFASYHLAKFQDAPALALQMVIRRRRCSLPTIERL